LAGSYLAVFLVVIGALSALAFALVAANFRNTLGPALDTPEGNAAFAASLRSVAASIVALDGALALVVGAASYWLARAAVRPLVDAREREARFAADAAHELRTPLGIISSVAQAARDDPVRTPAALAAITEHALDASTLIADLLTLARNPELRNLAREPVDLEALTARQVREHETAAAARGVRIALHSQSAIVDGDERRLNQLLRNLLDNALRYAVTSIDVAVRANGQRALVAIEDDGPGVAPELVDHIFERFAKEAASDGSGLGLAICRWVARSHGGDVMLESGSRFVLSLPLGNYPDLDRVT
jgi:two-component system, OmpR family, sensor kinase